MGWQALRDSRRHQMLMVRVPTRSSVGDRVWPTIRAAALIRLVALSHALPPIVQARAEQSERKAESVRRLRAVGATMAGTTASG